VALAHALGELGHDALAQAGRARDAIFMQQGITFDAAGPGAERATGLRSLAELPRFLAEAAGLEAHPWTEDPLPPGVSVAQFDPPRADDRLDEAIAALGLDAEGARRLTEPLTCVTDGRFKLLRRGEREELFDLEADPLELAPAVPGPDGVAARLREALAHQSLRSADVDAPAAPPIDSDELARLEEQMRLLGYM